MQLAQVTGKRHFVILHKTADENLCKLPIDKFRRDTAATRRLVDALIGKINKIESRQTALFVQSADLTPPAI